METITPKQFAEWLLAIHKMHEDSWDENAGGKTQDGFQYGAYKLRWSDCVETIVPELWRPIITCLLTPNGGYSEVWDWVEANKD